jgi:hypothetical protein
VSLPDSNRQKELQRKASLVLLLNDLGEHNKLLDKSDKQVLPKHKLDRCLVVQGQVLEAHYPHLEHKLLELERKTLPLYNRLALNNKRKDSVS